MNQRENSPKLGHKQVRIWGLALREVPANSKLRAKRLQRNRRAIETRGYCSHPALPCLSSTSLWLKGLQAAPKEQELLPTVLCPVVLLTSPACVQHKTQHTYHNHIPKHTKAACLYGERNPKCSPGHLQKSVGGSGTNFDEWI